MENETRLTRKGRVKPAPRIEPTYGTRSQRLARRQREALERQAISDAAVKAWKARKEVR